MFPKNHIIAGAIFSILLLITFPEIGWINALIVFLSSVLIDIDHYLYYIYKKKDWNLKRAYWWFVNQKDIFLRLNIKQRKSFKEAIFIFHGIEFWLVLILLVFLNKIFIFILLGISIHMILDFIYLFSWKRPLYIKTSQIYTHIKNKKKKDMIWL